MKTTFRVTDLDSMLWFLKLENMTVEDMRKRLTHTEPPNEKMAIGTAWHSILEDPPDSISEIEKNGITFRIECEYGVILPQVREIRAEAVYHIGHDEITLSGGCDGISGNIITDHKLTFRENLDTYFESYQWRAYLDIFNADIFQYYLYSAKQSKDAVVITDMSEIKMYRYPELKDDVIKGIRDLLIFVNEYIPEFRSMA